MAHRTISIKTLYSLLKEGKASGAITPGHMLERTSTADTVKSHAVAGQMTRLYAVEDELQGHEIGDAYTTANRVFFKAFLPGDEVYALIANGEDISIGDRLTSNGDGTLKKAAADSSGTVAEDEIAAIALEAVDMSDSSGADPSGRCIVEIM